MTGANAGVFTVASSTCGASVPRYASCSKDLAFTPAAQRARSGNLPSTDDAAGSPRAVALMGTGVLSPLTAVPTNVAATGPTEASR